jgi:hypothetical protein
VKLCKTTIARWDCTWRRHSACTDAEDAGDDAAVRRHSHQEVQASLEYVCLDIIDEGWAEGQQQYRGDPSEEMGN